MWFESWLDFVKGLKNKALRKQKGGTMVKDHGKQIKKDDAYEELKQKGYSKEKAARIANAQADASQAPSKKGGQSSKYEECTKDELYKKAKEAGIKGRSAMSKEELIEALRNH